MKQPIVFQRIEGLIVFAAAYFFYQRADFSLLWFLILLFSIDISMVGYLAGKKTGALIYNLAHAFVLPLIALVIGVVTENSPLTAFALIWLAHIGLDRALGYGLKFETGFQDTHLGPIGRSS